jgi:hypothetical protein
MRSSVVCRAVFSVTTTGEVDGDDGDEDDEGEDDEGSQPTFGDDYAI